MPELYFRELEDPALRYLKEHEYIVDCDCGNKSLPAVGSSIAWEGPDTYKFYCKNCGRMHEVTEHTTPNKLEIRLNDETVYYKLLEETKCQKYN